MRVELFACPGSGNCFKAWLAIQKLQIPHKLSVVDVLNGEQKSAEFLTKNPDGVVPFLVTSSGDSFGESNAMLWFLSEGSYLMPQSREARAKALQWMFFEQTKLEPFISPARFLTTIAPHLGKGRGDEIDEMIKRALPGLARLDDHLSRNRFILGDGFSLADISVFGYTHVADDAGISLSQFKSIERWINRVQETERFESMDGMSGSLLALAA